MPLVYKTGNLLDTPDPYIAHGCNSRGVFGLGVAKQIAKKWPHIAASMQRNYEYSIVNDTTPMKLGGVFVEAADERITILNCITQADFGKDKTIRYVSYDAVDNCMAKISKNFMAGGKISMPKIGAGI